MKVFIVDNSGVVRERLKTMLAEIEEVEMVGAAEEAVAALSSIGKVRPDAVILDIRLPGKTNGIHLLEKLKKNGNGPVAIILTNYPYPQYRQKCLQAGADFFFDKSTEFQEVAEVLRKLTRRSRRVRNGEKE